MRPYQSHNMIRLLDVYGGYHWVDMGDFYNHPEKIMLRTLNNLTGEILYLPNGKLAPRLHRDNIAKED
jgi:hypothetical protein